MTYRTEIGMLIVLSSALALVVARAWERTQASAPSQPAALLPSIDPQAAEARHDAGQGVSAPDKSIPKTGYVARAEALRTRAIREGRSTYLDVILSAYEPGVITPQVLASKARYRKRVSGKHLFLTDYSEIRTPFRVAEGRVVRDPLMSSSLEGMYDGLDGLAIIAKTAPPTVLYHELAHAIQKPATHRDMLGDPETFRAMREGRLTDSEERWLRYVSAPAELEIVMQDLNRRWSTAQQRSPILTPRDTVAALLHGFVPVDFAQASAAFLAEGQTLTEDEFRLLFIEARRSQPVPLGFRDASRLLKVHALAGRVSAEYRTRILQRIIFEAPGHL